MKIRFSALLAVLFILSCKQEHQKSYESEGLDFRMLELDTFIPVFPENPDSVKYSISMSFPELLNTNKLNSFIAVWLNREIFGDSLAARKILHPKDRLNGLLAELSPKYLSEAYDIMKMGIEPPEILNYEMDKKAKIIFNQDGFVIIEIVSYLYSGGAHGNIYSDYAIFDMEIGTKIETKQIFMVGYKCKLKKLIIDELHEIQKKQQGSPTLFSDSEIFVSNKFYFDTKNFYFVYDPYEIAPFSEGIIKVAIPLVKLKDLIRKDCSIYKIFK